MRRYSIPNWIGNARIPAVTVEDLSDQEWYKALKAKHGDKLHIGEPRAAGGRDAEYWDKRGMIGLYLEE